MKSSYPVQPRSIKTRGDLREGILRPEVNLVKFSLDQLRSVSHGEGLTLLHLERPKGDPLIEVTT